MNHTVSSIGFETEALSRDLGFDSEAKGAVAVDLDLRSDGCWSRDRWKLEVPPSDLEGLSLRLVYRLPPIQTKMTILSPVDTSSRSSPRQRSY